MKKILVKSLSIVLVIITVFSSMAIMASAAVAWPKISKKTPATAFSYGTGKTTVYTSESLSKKTGTFTASNEIKIYSIKKNSKNVTVAHCSFPIKNGVKYGYISLKAITPATKPTEAFSARASLTTFRRDKASQSLIYGTVSKGAKVYMLAQNSAWTQIMYSLGSSNNPLAWRIAWIPTTNYNKHIKITDAEISAMVGNVLSVAQKASSAAKKRYNTSAAVAYAKQHAYDGKGLCAEFVADCVAQAGIKIPNYSYYSSSTKSLTGNSLGIYTNPYTCSEAQLRWFKDNGFTVIKNPSFSQISVGDLVWNSSDGDDHVMIITGKNSSGRPLYSAHNKPKLDAPLYSVSFLVKLT